MHAFSSPRALLLGLLLLLALALQVMPRSAARADLPGPSGWLDATVWQAQDDSALTPLAGATLLLNDASGTTVAQAQSADDGTARLVAPPGAYSLVVFFHGDQAVGQLQCGGGSWDASGNGQYGDDSAVQESPFTLTLGRGVCRQYLFTPLPPPTPEPPPPPAITRPVYLTFDDGYVDLCQTVDLVDSLGIHATFFLTGQAIAARPDCVQRLVANGNRLGNHTYAHENLTTLSQSQIIATLQRTENMAEAVTGESTQPLCRPPYGAVNAFVRQVAAAWGCQMVLWNRDTLDWAGSSPAYIEAQALSVSCNGEIVLMHTQGYPNERIALPVIVSQLQAEGCQPTVLPY
jgi:peptidoglycan/xylan/chitin deacetylase (PgdA/CDA1 family)